MRTANLWLLLLGHCCCCCCCWRRRRGECGAEDDALLRRESERAEEVMTSCDGSTPHPFWLLPPALAGSQSQGDGARRFGAPSKSQRHSNNSILLISSEAMSRRGQKRKTDLP